MPNTTKRKPPRPKFIKLKWPIFNYNPQGLSQYSERELRKEYSRLRSAANKRLERLMDSEFWDAKTVQYNAGTFIPLAGVRNRSELYKLISQAARFLMSEQNSLTGQQEIRARLLDKWRDEEGMDFLNESNINDWVHFLEYVKEKEKFVYDVTEMQEVFRELTMDEQQGGDYTDRVRAAYEYYTDRTSRNPGTLRP